MICCFGERKAWFPQLLKAMCAIFFDVVTSEKKINTLCLCVDLADLTISVASWNIP